MNPWQMAQQLKKELQTVTWPSGSGEVVFGPRSVFVYAGAPPSEDQHPPGFPFALITIGGGTPDPDDPGVIEQTFTIAIAQNVVGDPLGENAVIGGSRADFGKSAGAGIAEVSERVRSAVQAMTAHDGAAVVVTGSGVGAPATMGQGRHIALDEFTVTALCTSQPRYAAPQELHLVGQTWSWEGDWCTPRFDFVQFRLGYVEGSTPATSPGGLDGIIYTGSNTEYPAAAAPGRVYQVFADYNGHGSASLSVVAASSDAEVGSYVLV